MTDLEARSFYRDLAARSSEWLKRQRNGSGLIGDLPALTPAEMTQVRQELEKCALSLKRGYRNCNPLAPNALSEGPELDGPYSSLDNPQEGQRQSVHAGITLGLMAGIGTSILSAMLLPHTASGVDLQMLVSVVGTMGAHIGGGTAAGGGIGWLQNHLCEANRLAKWKKQNAAALKQLERYENEYYWDELRRLGHPVPHEASERAFWWWQRVRGNAMDDTWVSDPETHKALTNRFTEFTRNIKSKFPDPKSWEHQTALAWEKRHRKELGRVPSFFAKHGKEQRVIENLFEILGDMRQVDEQMGLSKAGIRIEEALLPLKEVVTQRELTADDIWGKGEFVKSTHLSPHEALWGSMGGKARTPSTETFLSDMKKLKSQADWSPRLYDAIQDTQRQGGHAEIDVSSPGYEAGAEPNARLKRPGRAIVNLNIKLVPKNGEATQIHVPVHFSSSLTPEEMLTKEKSKWMPQVYARIEQALQERELKSPKLTAEEPCRDLLAAPFTIELPKAKEAIGR